MALLVEVDVEEIVQDVVLVVNQNVIMVVSHIVRPLVKMNVLLIV